jgi:cation:H+ antiporter
MILNALTLIAGMALLLGGGEALVRGAAALALRLRVSPAIIGLTIVAFGTSSPELAVNLAAAFTGKADMAFGNIIGSNIANVALVLGLCALIKPIKLESTMVGREIPMMILASLVALAMQLDDVLDHTRANLFSRGDGLVMLLLFGVFLYYTFAEVIRARATKDPRLTSVETDTRIPNIRPLFAAILTLLGIFGIVSGGQLTVHAASAIARAAGVSDVVIGLTIVAVGTSLPELVTSLVATYRGRTEIAVGNIIGSNLFNLLFVLGLSALVTPIPIPRGGIVDMIAMNAFALILLPLALTHRRYLVRWEATILLSLYAGYLTVRIVN